MRIGFQLPQLGPVVSREAPEVARFAREAEAMGAGSLWVGDRLLAPVNPTVGYPPGQSDTIPEEFHHILDPLALLTVAATATEQALIGSNVLNAPWYPPALLARFLTTVDVISGGRLLPGFGSGWMPEEYQAAGVPFAERGSRLDEFLDALDQLWTAEPAEYHGQHWTVPATHARLKPARRPPVYLAGFSPAAQRRIARRADGWIPVLPLGDAVPDLTAAVAEPMARLRQLAEREGRDPAALDLILRVYPDRSAAVGDIVTTIHQARDKAAVRHVVVDLMFLGTSIDHTLELAGTILNKT